jgi:hypothetical protein
MGLGDFFRDYGTPFATAVAVINTVITVTVGQYFKDSPRARAVLVAASMIFGCIAIIATFYSQHEIVATRDAEAARRVAVREGIGKLIEEGQNLQNECADAATPLPKEAVIDWETQAKAFLSANLGPSYVTRFGDPIGASPLLTVSMSAMSDDRRNLFIGIYVRIFRLEQFSQQLPI